MKKIRRNLQTIIVTATTLTAIIIVLVGCARSGTLTQPTGTIPVEVERKTSEIDTSEGDETAPLSTDVPTAEPESSPTVQSRDLSTPELIEQAFTKGEITADQRLLYLAYAVGDYDKLPLQYRGNVPWRSTLTRLELTEVATSPSVMCTLSPFVQSELRRVLTVGVTCDH